MHKDLAKYILSLPDDISVRIWLKAYSEMKRNGTTIIPKRQTAIELRITEPLLDKYFNPKHAEELGLIKLLPSGETFIAINFRLRETPVKLKPTQIKEEKAANPAMQILPAVPSGSNNNLPVEVQLDDHGLIISHIQMDYKMTDKLKRWIINDYCQFFKKLQIQKGLLIGSMNVKPVNPKLSEKDVKHLKDIARHFVSIGYDTEPKVLLAFSRLYEQWEHLPDRLQKMSSPGGIYACLNDIVLELIELNNKKTKTKITPKDEQLNDKIEAARRKDNSRLAKT